MSHRDLMNLVARVFAPDFIKWEMDVPGYGVPLVMGRLANINGLKIYLGIGTDKRGTRRWHRQEAMRLVG